MRHIIAFDQIRLVVDQVVNLWIEKEFYKSRFIQLSGITPEQAEEALRQAKNDPESQRQANERFTGLRQSLDDLGQALVADECGTESTRPGHSN